MAKVTSFTKDGADYKVVVETKPAVAEVLDADGNVTQSGVEAVTVTYTWGAVPPAGVSDEQYQDEILAQLKAQHARPAKPAAVSIARHVGVIR